MALIQHMESVGSPEKSAGRATLNSGVDCLLMAKGWVGTVDVNDVGMRLGLRGWFSSSLEAPLDVAVGNV